MDSKTITESAAEPCEQCRIGHCQPTKAPYIYWIKKQVLVFPNAPAYCCDICGQLQYDAGFLATLEMMLQELEFGMQLDKLPKSVAQPDVASQWQPTRGR